MLRSVHEFFNFWLKYMANRAGKHESARYGLHAERVGEASHPVPSLRIVTSTGWASLDRFSLADEFKYRVRTLQGVPAFLRGQFRAAMRVSLKALTDAYETGDERDRVRAWTLFKLTPRVLLWRRPKQRISKREFARRFERFANQEWPALIAEARDSAQGLNAEAEEPQRQSKLATRPRLARA